MKIKSLWCIVMIMSLYTVAMAQVHPMSPKNENSIWNRMKGTLSNEAYFKANQNTSKLNSTVTSSWNGESMEVGAKNEYSYENDQLISNERFLMVESEWAKDWKTEYIYSDGLLSSVTNLNYDFGTEAYIAVDQYKYAYQTIDNKKLLLTELYREWEEGSGWVSIYKFDYEYENGLISGGSEYSWETTQWIEIDRFMATSENDTTTITYFAPEADNWVEYSREIYPSLTLGELYDFYTEFITDINFEFTYLSLEFPDYIYQEKADGVWENVDGQLTIDFFDTFEGKLKMREIQQLFWLEEWAVSYNNEIWYNQKDRPDSATVYVFLSEGKQAAGQEIYSYNEASQLSQVDFLQNIGFGLNLQSTTILNWEIGTSNEPKSNVSSFKLSPAYPNPFNPTTNITYSMEKAGNVRINVYDMLGRFITTLVNGSQTAGEHHVLFDADNLASGIYIVRMEADGYQKNQLITLLK